MKKKRSSHKQNPLKPYCQGMFLGFIIFSCLFCGFSCFMLSWLMSVARDHDPADATRYAEKYFPPTLVANLCNQNAIPSEITDCSQSPTLQFYQMRQVVNAQIGRPYEDIFELFGNYQQLCPFVTPSPSSITYRCVFRFDTGYNLTFEFDAKTHIFLGAL